MNDDLRREIDREIIKVIKTIPAIQEKVDNIHTALMGNGGKGLKEKVEDLEEFRIKSIAYTSAISSGVLIILKLFKIL